MKWKRFTPIRQSGNKEVIQRNTRKKIKVRDDGRLMIEGLNIR